MTLQTLIRTILPLKAREFIYRQYADHVLQQAIDLAEANYRKDGHRYYVLPCKNGKLKVTNVDTETRDKSRLNDKRLLKRTVRMPYQLRKESFYFTASDVCKKKYNPSAMLPWELEAGRKNYHDWFFSSH